MMENERNIENDKRWNVFSLKEYFDLAVTSLEEKIDQRFQSTKEAVDKAEITTEKRFENTNEWRKSYEDLIRTNVPRKEYEVGHERLLDRVSNVERKLEKIENIKEGANIVWAYILAGVSFVAAIVSVTINLLKL